MSDFYGSSDDAVNRQVLSSALQQQVTLWDTADMYGPFTNETLLGRFFKENPGSRERVQLATKFGNRRNEQGDFLGMCGTPEYVKSACEASLQRLGVDCIDLYYQHGWIHRCRYRAHAACDAWQKMLLRLRSNSGAIC